MVTCWVYVPPGMACSEEEKRFTRDAVGIIFSKQAFLVPGGWTLPEEERP